MYRLAHRALPATTIMMLLSACASSPTATQTQETTPARTESSVPPAAAATANSTAGPAATSDTVATSSRAAAAQAPEVATSPAERSVYFDFDQYVIRTDQQARVGRHAAQLKARPNLQVQIQGHADERGSREYNLALGQRRADAVRRMLNTLGVEATRMETISYGEEAPKAKGHDEASWAENRRGDLLFGK